MIYYNLKPCMFKLSALSGFGLPRVLNLRDTQGVNTETFAIEYSSQLLKIIDNNINIIIGKVKKMLSTTMLLQ